MSMSNLDHHCFGSILVWSNLSKGMMHSGALVGWVPMVPVRLKGQSFGPHALGLGSFNGSFLRKNGPLTWSFPKKDGGGYAVTGSKDLKGSQAYTPEFAMSIMSIWLQEREPKTPDLENVQLPNFYKPHTDRWEDAKLSEVFQYLSLN